jgi:flagellar basal-body rod modification protein FlgD
MGLNIMQINSTANIIPNAAKASATSATGTNPTGAGNSSPLPPQVLSQADFLKLLVAQMTSQDPLNPTTTQDLLTQTVQLSTLQSNNTLQSTLSALQNSQAYSQADSLLGRQVILQVDAKTTTQGVVSGIDVSTGTPMLVVNGAEYSLGQVLAISTPSPNQ